MTGAKWKKKETNAQKCLFGGQATLAAETAAKVAASAEVDFGLAMFEKVPPLQRESRNSVQWWNSVLKFERWRDWCLGFGRSRAQSIRTCPVFRTLSIVQIGDWKLETTRDTSQERNANRYTVCWVAGRCDRSCSCPTRRSRH